MRIHSDSLNRYQIEEAAKRLDGVSVHITGTHGSRQRRIAFEVALRGHRNDHRRAPQGRVTSDPSSEKAATYDDWGKFLHILYRNDTDMVAGPYKNRADFNSQTKHKFA